MKNHRDRLARLEGKRPGTKLGYVLHYSDPPTSEEIEQARAFGRAGQRYMLAPTKIESAEEWEAKVHREIAFDGSSVVTRWSGRHAQNQQLINEAWSDGYNEARI
jgi:hypothetical protein